jgi:hypothetical protein
MADTDAPAPVPTVASLKQWGVGKEERGMTVSFTLADLVEARAWSTWLFDREVELDQAVEGGF